MATRTECPFTGPILAHGISGVADAKVFEN
jgi:hypothetical protein